MECFVCSCYFSNNIFLHSYTLHVTYHTEQQFLEDYKEVLRSRGCEGEEQLKQALADVQSEVQRRRDGGKKQVERCTLIKQTYRPLHPSVYTLQESYFEPAFLRAVSYARTTLASPEGLLDLMEEERAANTFSLPVFTPDFCAWLMEELEHFEKTDLPKGRPNTMNRGGLLLSELGFDEKFIDSLRRDYLMPLARLLYPDWVGGGLDSHRAFVVKYTMSDDVELSYHYDNAEVTLNVCLGREFEGGDLYFGSMRTERDISKHKQHVTYQHRVGVRYNLIIWMRSSSVRNTLCPMCNNPPTLVPNLGYGDGFTV